MAFKATIDAARLEVMKGHSTPALVLLRGLIREVDLTVDLRRMSKADAAAVEGLVERAIGWLDVT